MFSVFWKLWISISITFYYLLSCLMLTFLFSQVYCLRTGNNPVGLDIDVEAGENVAETVMSEGLVEQLREKLMETVRLEGASFRNKEPNQDV